MRMCPCSRALGAGVFFLVFTCHRLCGAFNLDTEHPVLFRSVHDFQASSHEQTYFGFAVGLVTSSFTGKWLMVGAPRANSSLALHNVHDTGVLLRCGLAQANCTEVVLDPNGNELHSTALPYYHERRQFSWTAGAMATLSDQDTPMVVCAHRWVNQLGGNSFFSNGMCYFLDSSARDYNASKRMPLLENGRQVFTDDQGNKVRMFGFGQAGISAELSSDGEELLLGAPGVYNWKGSVVRYSRLTFDNPSEALRRRRRDTSAHHSAGIPLAKMDVATSYRGDQVLEGDYFGYSVSSGHFFSRDTLTYVAGAPRAGYGYGKAYLFNFGAGDGSPIGVLEQRMGAQVGEYFGASVLALDLSGDGWAELVVGAPLWTSSSSSVATRSVEHGRVCVYVNGDGSRGGVLAAEPLVLTGSARPSARFGTVLAAVGDVDHDGYDDLAVGAPYEEDERGAIYIYHGASHGLIATYSQRISASQLSDSLRGFGVSVSRGVDMDDNGYSDVAVGSYLSGEAVLLRAQPVLRFQADFRSTTERLNTMERQFSVNACLKYFGTHLVKQVDVAIRLTIDSMHVPASFHKNNSQSVQYARTIKYDVFQCDDWIVDIEPMVVDFTQPLKLSMHYNLSDSDTTSSSSSSSIAKPVILPAETVSPGETSGLLGDFCATCPVVDVARGDQRSVSTTVPFSLDCGSDEVCSTQLTVAVRLEGLSGGRFVIGSRPSLELLVEVNNRGEPASLPSVQVSLPPAVRLVRVPRLCFEPPGDDVVQLSCQLQPHPLTGEDTALLRLELDMRHIQPGSEQLPLVFNVSSSGEETQPEDNVLNYTLALKTEADIAVSGQALEEQIYYDKREDRDESERDDAHYVWLSHRYQVARYMDSPLPSVNISFLVPVNLTSTSSGAVVRFADVYRPRASVDSEPLDCTISTGYYLSKEGDSYQTGGATLSHVTATSQQQQRHLDIDSPVPRVPGGNALVTHLTCGRSASGSRLHVACARVECGAVAFNKRQTTVVVTLRLRIKLHELEPVVGKYDRLVVSTTALAEVSQGRGQRLQLVAMQPAGGGRPDQLQLHSQLLPSSLRPFPVWIIVAAVVGALLLLAAITYGLYKVGFFNRRRRPEDL